MEINKDLRLNINNFYEEEHNKRQIVIGNTNTTDMAHYDFWKRKLNGKYKGTAPYTIGMDGTIYEHFDPKYHSESLNIRDYDKFIIPILLENEGWLTKDFKNNIHINWCGSIYNREDEIVKIKWRNKLKWAPYTEKQLSSLVLLTNDLIKKFNIKRFVSEHNVKIEGVELLEGIFFRSNYSSYYYDISPAFNIEKFKKLIEE